MDTKRVGILLFDQVELLDFAGPVEVLWSARARGDDGRWVPFFEILLLAEVAGTIRTAQGVDVVAPLAIADCPPLDVVLVPGGWGTRAQMKNARLLAWLRERAAAAEITSSVCTGALVLGAAGLLEGRRATTHRDSLPLLASSFPGIRVVADEQVVVDGALLTSAGVSAGIDLALLIVRHYLGEGAARTVARNIEYPYPESNDRRVAAT